MSLAEGQAVQVRRSGRWVDASVLSIDGSGRVLVRVDGKRRGYPAEDVRPAREATRLALPDDDEGPELQRSTVCGSSFGCTSAAGPTGVCPTHLARSTGTVRAPLVAVPKQPATRSASFLELVRSKPCCCCGQVGSIEAHHIVTGGMGRKTSDRLTAPLLTDHHHFWHAHGHLPSMDRTSSMACLWEASARIQDEYDAKKEPR